MRLGHHLDGVRASSRFARQCAGILAAGLLALSGAASAQDGPADPRYAALEDYAAQYEGLVRSGGWPALAAGPTRRAGDAGADIAALRARLATEGFACAGEAADPALFDDALECAVRAFQDRRGLETDGAVGPRTLEALNVPAQDRLAQIGIALQRWRDLPDPLPPTRIEVNSAGAEAALYLGGAPALQMRVIVGRPATATPDFAAEVRAVIVNPEWNVPDSIARNEILPRAAADPGYLSRNHFVRRGARLVQLPGADNALGRIKLDMPNPHTVYLHDTSAPSLFDTPRRYYSHGCMRMQYPREMAALLLQDQGWTREAIDAAIDAAQTRSIPLSAPAPVFVYYHTAYVRGDGALVLQPDVYGRDARWLRERAAAESAQLAAFESECALSAG